MTPGDSVDNSATYISPLRKDACGVKVVGGASTREFLQGNLRGAADPTCFLDEKLGVMAPVDIVATSPGPRGRGDSKRGQMSFAEAQEAKSPKHEKPSTLRFEKEKVAISDVTSAMESESVPRSQMASMKPVEVKKGKKRKPSSPPAVELRIGQKLNEDKVTVTKKLGTG